MAIGYYNVGYAYGILVKLNPNEKAFGNFTVKEENWIEENRIKNRPPDLDLHISLYLLEKENCPDDLLNPIKQWVFNNQKATPKNLITV